MLDITRTGVYNYSKVKHVGRRSCISEEHHTEVGFTAHVLTGHCTNENANAEARQKYFSVSEAVFIPGR